MPRQNLFARVESMCRGEDLPWSARFIILICGLFRGAEGFVNRNNRPQTDRTGCHSPARHVIYGASAIDVWL